MIKGCNFKCEMDKEWKRASSFFQSETYEVSFIFAQHSYENNDAIHIPSNVVVCDIFVKVNPSCSMLPMSIVVFVNANPWDLWIVNTQSILRGICFLLLRFMGGIGM